MSRDSEQQWGQVVTVGAWFICTLLVSAGTGLALARVSADSPRPYTVLDPAASVEFGGQQVRVDHLAQQHVPVVLPHPDLGPDPVTGISYEAAREGDDLLLRYFVSWADEQHPNPIAHQVYRWYRIAYFAGARDIEYVQLRLDPHGAVTQVRFETSGASDLRTWLPVHVDAVADLEGEELVRRLLDEADAGVEQTLRVPFDGRVRVCVVSWNHLLDLATAQRCADAGETPGVDPGLAAIPLTEQGYRDAAASRRGHPDPANGQTMLRAVAGYAGAALFAGAPLIALAVAGLRGWRIRRR